MRKNLSNKFMHGYAGFTLIELMFAFMLLAWGFMRLLEGQANTIQSSKESQQIIIATQLARSKLHDCKEELFKLGFASLSDFADEGDFSEDGFEEYAWECHGTRIDVPAPNLNALGGGIGSQTAGLSSLLGPIFSLLASTLGDSARELTATVRWSAFGQDDEITLTTHLIDTRIFSSAMSAVSGALKPQAKEPQRNSQ